MKRCPYCAEDIQDEAIKCKHCGEWLRQSDQKDQPNLGKKNQEVSKNDGKTEVYNPRLLNKEEINIQQKLNEKPINNNIAAPQKEKARDKDKNYLVQILCIIAAVFGMFIGRKYPLGVVLFVLIILMAFATYYCFKPISLSASDYKKKRNGTCQ